MSNPQLEAFTRAYMDCALWSSTDDDGTPLDENHDADDFDPTSAQLMEEDCAKFYSENEAAIQCDNAPLSSSDLTASESERKAMRAGHDFWLTRNGHGAGFWDGDWPAPHGKTLDQASRKYPSVHCYVGYDGLIWMDRG